MSYSTKYRIVYEDQSANQIQIDIQLRDYSGAITQVKSGEVPFSLKYDKSGDSLFESVKPTSADITFWVETNGTFDEFYDIDSFQYKVIRYKNSNLNWVGWVTDNIFQEEYSPGKYFVSIYAIDGLGMLKNHRTELTGRKSHFTIIAEGLQKINLGLNIVDCINIWENNHSQTDGPLVQTRFNTDLFVDGSKRLTLYDTLVSVLELFPARISQQKGKWVIAPLDSIYNGLTGFEYSQYATKIGTFSFNETKIISKFSDATHVNLLTGGTIEKEQAYKQLTVKQILGKQESVAIPNGTFDDYSEHNNFATIIQPSNWETDLTSIPQTKIEIRQHSETGPYIFLAEPSGIGTQYYIRNKIENSPYLVADSSKEYVFSVDWAVLESANLWGKHKIAFRVEMHNNNGTVYYLDYDNATWVTNSVNIEREKIDQQNQNDFNWQNLTCKVNEIPGGRIVVYAICFSKTIDIAYVGIAIDNVRFYASEVNDQTAVVYKTGLNNSNFNYVPESLNFDQNDVPGTTENAELYYKNYLSLTDGTPTSNWSSGAGYSGQLSDICLKSILTQKSKSQLLKKFSIIGEINPFTKLIDESGRTFAIVSFEENNRENQYSIETIEIIQPNTATITISEEEFSNDKEQNNSSDSGSTSATSSSKYTDKMVSMVDENGVDTAPPARLQDGLFYFEGLGNHGTYVSRGVGYGLRNAFNDYKETLAGTYPTIGTGNETEWIETDRLHTMGNGPDADNRHDAAIFYKSGLMFLNNAIQLRKFKHGEDDALPGTLQFDEQLEVHTGEDFEKIIVTSDIEAITVECKGGLRQ